MLADPLEEVQSILTDACPVVSLLRSMSLGTAFLANIWFLGASAWWVARARWQWGRRGGLGLAVVGLVLSANAWMLALPAFEFGDRLLFGYYLWAGSLSAQVVATGLQAWHDRRCKTKEGIVDSPCRTAKWPLLSIDGPSLSKILFFAWSL